eukprot:tig00020704_g13170.t1
MDGGTTIRTLKQRLTTLKVLATAVDCNADEPTVLEVATSNNLWIRSAGVTVRWVLPEVLAARLPGSLSTTKPVLVVPKGVFTPGETLSLTVIATDTTQNPPSSSSLGVTVVVGETDLEARIVGGERLVPPFSALRVDARASSDPDYGSLSRLSYTWLVLPTESATTSFELAAPLYTSGRRTEGLATLPSPSAMGLTPGANYTLVLLLESLRPTGRMVNATATKALFISPGPVPSVAISETVPSNLLFVQPGESIQIRCEAEQADNPAFAAEAGFVWSAPDGEEELFNLSRLAIRTSARSSTLVLSPSAVTLSADRTYRIRCSAYAQSQGVGNSGSQDVEVRRISGPTPGTCSIDPASGIALKTQFVIECSGWTSRYSETLLYELRLMSPTGTSAMQLSQPAQAALIRTLLPAPSAFSNSNVTVAVIVSDQLTGAQTRQLLSATVSLDVSVFEMHAAGTSGAVQAGKSAIKDLLSAVKSRTDAVFEDGDREALLAAVALASSTVTALIDRSVGSASVNPSSAAARLEDDEVEALVGPLLDMIGALASSNGTAATNSEFVQSISAVSALSDVVVRTSSASMQSKLAGYLKDLLGSLDPCTSIEQVSSLLLGAADSFASSTSWGNGDATLSEVVQEALRRFAARAAACSACGQEPVGTTGLRLSLLYTRVCAEATGDTRMTTGDGTGAAGGSLVPASVAFGRGVRELVLAQSSNSSSYTATTTAHLRSPYPTATSDSSASINATGLVLDVDVTGFDIQNLTDLIRIEIPFPPAFLPTLPMSLIFWRANATVNANGTVSGAWAIAGNITELQNRTTSIGTWYFVGIGFTSHLTSFSIGPAITARSVVPGGASAGMADWQTPGPHGQQAPSGEAVPPWGIALICVGAFAVVVLVVVVAIRARRRASNSAWKWPAAGSRVHDERHSNAHADVGGRGAASLTDIVTVPRPAAMTQPLTVNVTSTVIQEA